MVMGVPTVKLHDHSVVDHELLILRTAMSTRETHNCLIPAAADFNVTNRDEWLRNHGFRLDSEGRVALQASIAAIC